MSLIHVVRDFGCRAVKPDGVHGRAEFIAIFGFMDYIAVGANHFDAVFFEHAHLVKTERGVERSLATKRWQNRIRPFFFNHSRHEFGRNRLDISRIGQLRVGHDGRRIGINQNQTVALFSQSLNRLRAGIIELTGLPNDDGAGTDDEDGLEVCAARHGGGIFAILTATWAVENSHLDLLQI